MSDAVINPRLLAISGAETGTVYPIPTDGSEVTVGRAPDNTICILDPLASKHEFALRWEDGRTLLQDRQSKKGIRIDRRYYSNKHLLHGERIMVGLTPLIHLVHADALDAVENLKDEIDKERFRFQNALTIRTYEDRDQENLYYRDVWKALSDTARYVNAIPDLNELQVRILETAFDIIPARRGAILLNGANLSPDPSDLSSQVYRELDREGPSRSFLSSLDSIALSTVYSTRKPYISNKVVAVLCLPVFQDGVMKGVFYLDAGNRDSRFTSFEPKHLALTSAFTENLSSALALHRKIQTTQNHRDLLLEAREGERPIIGASPGIVKVLEDIDKAAAFEDVTVLILGETGTGKELVARAIHEKSHRKDKPLAVINCGGITGNLLLSELFGHAKGAFTGAVSARKGKLRQAEGGTAFLDEMGELPLDLQAALLRVLQEKKGDPVGEDKPVDIDVRIIAATNVGLEKAVKEGKFRRDLYYRLNVVTIHIPPLRERPEDIPLLVDYFLRKHGSDAAITIAPEAMDALVRFSWPGNVRELENAIQAAIVNIYRSSDIIRLGDLPKCIREGSFPETPRDAGALQQSHDTADAVLLGKLERRLDENGGNVREAATYLGMGKTKAYELLKKQPS